MKKLRPVILHPSDPALALVELTRGHFATISAVDSLAVGRYNWTARETRGAVYAYGQVDGKQTPLHRFVGALAGLTLRDEVDHRNGNSLDCRRSNLRDATVAENLRNRGMLRSNTSGVKGVTWSARAKKWKASLWAGGAEIHLGYFVSKDDAGAIVRAEREKLHGEFARHN